MKNLNREKQIERLVSNARAILSNQIALPLGIEKMHKIICQIEHIKPINKINLEIFHLCYTKISIYPLGTERLNYDEDYLFSQDNEMASVLENYKKTIIAKCFEIIRNQNLWADS